MQTTSKIKSNASVYNTVLSAVEKLSLEERQLLRLQLFTNDALAEMKAFEAALKKKKSPVVKTDVEIVKITTTILSKKFTPRLSKASQQ